MQCIDETKLSALFMLLSWFGKNQMHDRCRVYLQEKTGEDIPMSSYFRFIAFLAFKIFSIVG
jgi:hypothetical protein